MFGLAGGRSDTDTPPRLTPHLPHTAPSHGDVFLGSQPTPMKLPSLKTPAELHLGIAFKTSLQAAQENEPYYLIITYNT